MAIAIVVETGAGLSNSNVYCDEVYADAYFTARGNTTWVAQSTDQKRIALIQGCDWMTRTYRNNWRGGRAVQFQALDWPRMNVHMHDYIWSFDGRTYSVLPYNIIPDDIAKANCEAADMARLGTILPITTTGQIRKSIKVGSLQIEYENGLDVRRPSRFIVVRDIINPYTKRTGSSSRQLVRT